jgi:hypothetical protein
MSRWLQFDPTVQNGIDQTMRELINNRSVPGPSSIAGPTNSAPRATVAREVPLALPPGQDHIERIANAMAPHGAKSPLRWEVGDG